MCMVSMVSDYGSRVWPNPQTAPYRSPWADYPILPNTLPPTDATRPYYPPAISPEDVRKIKEFLGIVEKAKEFDKMNEQPDCPDPKKVAYLESLEKRVEELEKRLAEQNKTTEGPQFLQD